MKKGHTLPTIRIKNLSVAPPVLNCDAESQVQDRKSLLLPTTKFSMSAFEKRYASGGQECRIKFVRVLEGRATFENRCDSYWPLRRR